MTSQPQKSPRAASMHVMTLACVAVLSLVGLGCDQDNSASRSSAGETGQNRRPDMRNRHAEPTDLTTLGPDGVPQGDVEDATPTETPGKRRQRGGGVRRPRIIHRFIPFPARRKREMTAYARRHYGIGDYRLMDPQVIVEHFTVTDSVEGTYNVFAPDVADVELHELPQVCSHYVVDRSGSIYQLVALGIMCRHTVGLNYTSVGIEHVGRSDQEILGNARQLRASLRLTTWLRCRFAMKVEDVIGHNESLLSPYHQENVARLRSQTHADWNHADMQIYRKKLRRLHCG